MEKIRLLVLRITERCDLACRYCYAAGGSARDMDMETAAAAIELACPGEGPLRVQLTGGEPVLSLGLAEEIARYGRTRGKRLAFSLQTNATLIDEGIAERIKELGCAVGVSLDGIGASNSLRVYPDGRESFTDAVNGVRCLAGEGVICNLTCVVSSANDGRLEELADLAAGLGNIRGIGLDVFRPLGHGAENDYSPDAERLKEGIKKLKAKAENYKKAGIPIVLREKERIKMRASSFCSDIYCFAQTRESFCVCPDGSIWPCSSLAGMPGLQMGHVKAGLGIDADGVRKTLLPPEGCMECGSFKTCLGGCPAGRLASADPKICCAVHDAFKDGDLQ